MILAEAAGRIRLVGWCQGSNARDGAGRTCSVHGRASAFSMYGAICNVLGPGVGDKALQNSAFWHVVSGFAQEPLPTEPIVARSHALHALNDDQSMTSVRAIGFLQKWSDSPKIIILGEFR